MNVVFCQQFWVDLGFLMEDGSTILGFRRELDCGVCVEVEGTKRS